MGRVKHFSETMSGTWQKKSENGYERPLPLSFTVTALVEEAVKPLGTVNAELRGTIEAESLAKGSLATGDLEMSPVENKRIRYRLEFIGDDQKKYFFDGWKSISWLRPLSTWTTLPGSIEDEEGNVVGKAELKFDLSTTPKFLKSFGFESRALETRRFDGKKGRLEVWYDTFSDPDTGYGYWLHHEIVSPLEGEAYAHGWIGVFPPDASPIIERFGPKPLKEGSSFDIGEVRVSPSYESLQGTALRIGSAGGIEWDLKVEGGDEPLYTFPKFSWENELLPACQVVPHPSAIFSGTIKINGKDQILTRAKGGAARIYGHGNAKKWAWLHGDLGGGDVIEVVAAVSMRKGLAKLRALPFIQIRIDGKDWPKKPLFAAAKFRATFFEHGFEIKGRLGRKRATIKVDQPKERCLEVAYKDPDGKSATCINCERSDVYVLVERRGRKGWETVKEVKLEGNGHSEIGMRP